MGVWVDVFRSPIPACNMVEEYAYLLAIDATLVAIGIVKFQRRDFKS
jgi:putative exporter of polyketide antibiotics